MSKEITSYPSIIRGAQQEWRSWRAKGVKSLARFHQTIELPASVAARFQYALIDALPIDTSIKQALMTEHPPLIIGWALGPDDRDRNNKYNTKNNSTIPIPSDLGTKQENNYVNGMLWVEELITGQATVEAMHSLHSLPLYTFEGAISRIFLNSLYAKTDPAIVPSRLSQLATMLRDPTTRINLMNAWFSGDRRYANRIIYKETDMSLKEFTLKMGRTHSYKKRSKEHHENNNDGGIYITGRGIAYIHGRLPWLMPIAASLPLIVNEALRVIDLQSPSFVATYYVISIGLLTILSQIPPSQLAHETIHYLGEGENHTGWYKTTLFREP